MRMRGRQSSQSPLPSSGDLGSGSESEGAAERAKFTEGSKGASFARAFEKIMAKNAKVQAKTASKPEAAAIAPPGSVPPPILSESRSIAKRKAEEEEASAAHRAHKRLKQELRTRGRMKVPKKGEDPAHDVREKGLTRLANRGVVLLFNAVSKAQRAQQEASAATGSKKANAKASREAFLAQLKQQQQAQQQAGPGLMGPFGGGVLGLRGPAGGKPKNEQEQQPGWQVLQDSFTGLTGGSKMKDFDKTGEQQEQDAATAGGQIEAHSDSGAGDDDGW